MADPNALILRGLHAETKPTALPGTTTGRLPVGSRFIEINNAGMTYDWDGTAWAVSTQPFTGGSAGGGGGGGASTVADGADVTLGAKANTAATDSTSAWSVISLLKGLYALLAATLKASPQAATSGGSLPYKYISAGSAGQDAQVVKASAGQIYSISAFNATTSARYLKVYKMASAPASTDTPFSTYLIPGGAYGSGVVEAVAVGVEMTTGIAFRITAGMADNDANAASANDVVVNFKYK